MYRTTTLTGVVTGLTKKKELATVIVGLFSLKEKAPTKNGSERIRIGSQTQKFDNTIDAIHNKATDNSSLARNLTPTTQIKLSYSKQDN